MFRVVISEWRNIDWPTLRFAHVDEAILIAVVFLSILFIGFVTKFLRKKTPGRTAIVLPGIIPEFRKSSFGFLRHLPVALFFMGLPFFLVALADPYDSFTKEQVTYPGRKIVMLIDASGSMDSGSDFEIAVLKIKAQYKKRFYTAVAAAERLIQLRIKGKYKDLMGLVEFGSEAYVITPFTNDYDNILMSIKLIGEPEERARFKDTGTIIIKAIDQGVGLFRAFDFLDAAGNAMILISDGEDHGAILGNRTLDEILEGAIINKIPIYFVRTAYGIELGTQISKDNSVMYNFDLADEIWKNAVEKTGGKFYAGANEKAILDALDDIDKLNTGNIKVVRHNVRQPRFILFVLISLTLWVGALFSYLFFRFFRKFP